MAGLIYELNDLLYIMCSEYEKLIKLGREKSGAIVANNIDDIQGVTARENECVGKINSLEKQRLTLMQDVASVLNFKGEELTISVIGGLLKNQPEESKTILDLGKRLAGLLMELKEVNDQNGILVAQSLEFIEYSINSITSSQMPEPPSYGNVVKPNIHGFFDRKQ